MRSKIYLPFSFLSVLGCVLQQTRMPKRPMLKELSTEKTSVPQPLRTLVVVCKMAKVIHRRDLAVL